jgi:hypothetical protein
LTENYEIVLAAVKNHGFALKYANDTLKRNDEIVFAAVTKHGGALQYASNALRDNEEFLYMISECRKIIPGNDIFLEISPRIQAEIIKDAKYLENFGPCNMKPAKG